MALVGRFILPAIALRAVDEHIIDVSATITVDEDGRVVQEQTTDIVVTTTLVDSPAVASQTPVYSVDTTQTPQIPQTPQTPQTPSAATENLYHSAVSSSSQTPRSDSYGQASKGSAYNAKPVTTTKGNATESASNKLFGIAYAPYRADHECKSADETKQDFQIMGQFYSLVRIYGTACADESNFFEAAKAHNMKVFLGIWDTKSIEKEVEAIRKIVNGDWGYIHTISVGNEMVNSGQAEASEMVKAVNDARRRVREIGYTGPVVTVDTFGAYKNNPDLEKASDYCAFNGHGFYDSTNPANSTGPWLKKVVKDSCQNLENAVVAESGWPKRGISNGKAVPGVEEQAAALRSITEVFPTDAENGVKVILFSAFDDKWKDPGLFNVEQSWGIHG
ncbi:hypothetical protein L249_1643 [Ophiocordyceps polyrhachis-furcata BCC 54312]|uniref:Uncharacterized protein n=1 Tax=Ophiocordyceps polyrhachis-furcata BCC 54312 TaxID=1330021 RepID=A0A367KZH7_9HYPO|nr:hypothetical protein L249_1643 [Ophiocordyceps polyrhachis-furcata BCC 54312]